MDMKYEPAWHASPVVLPEASSGKAQIRHRILKAGEKVSIIGMRQAYLRGTRPACTLLPEPLLVHELTHEDHGVWMTDLPEELNQIAELLFNVRPTGRVLVGGLGLGILPSAVTGCEGVEQVIVIELDEDVINLCAKGTYCDVIIKMDIIDYLRTTSEHFDYYLLDTWQGTGECTWWEDVMPLRRLIRGRWGTRPVVHCWAEDIMQGQIFRNLTHCPPHWYTKYLSVPMPENEARAFLRNVGWPSWERKYGEAVDSAIAEQKEA